MSKDNVIGKEKQRWDAIAKVQGKAKFTDDFFFPQALHGKILHATISHGFVKSYDISEAKKMPGVVKVLLPEDLAPTKFATAGHPFSMNPAKRDIEDRSLLTRNVRVYGDEIAAVVAKTEHEAKKALEKIKVEYEEYPVYLTPKEAMSSDALRIHEERDNVIASTEVGFGDIEAGKNKADHILEESFSTTVQQHIHLENQVAISYQDAEQRWKF